VGPQIIFGFLVFWFLVFSFVLSSAIVRRIKGMMRAVYCCNVVQSEDDSQLSVLKQTSN